MTIPEPRIYPRTGDNQIVYLKNVSTRPGIIAGDYTIYNDFVNDPRLFRRNNVLYQYPINHDRLIIGKYYSIACGTRFCSPAPTIRAHSQPIPSRCFLRNGVWTSPM